MAAYPPPPGQQQQAVVEHGREPCPDRILGERRGHFHRAHSELCTQMSRTRRRGLEWKLPAPRSAAPWAHAHARARRTWLAPPLATPARAAPPARAPPADDIGGAFGMGALGGGLWHTYRGLKNSPKGYKIAGTLEVGQSARAPQ
jgi:hypothetical protein